MHSSFRASPQSLYYDRDGDDEDEDGDVKDDDHLGDAHDGAEALLLGEEHVVLHVAEDGRLHEQPGAVQPLASKY